MQRCRRNDVSAVRCEVMWRRVRPILPHTNAISQVVPLAKAFRLPKSDARTHRTPKALRAKSMAGLRPGWRSRATPRRGPTPRRRRRRRRGPARWRHAHVINVLLMLAPTRVEVESRRVRHIASSVVGHDSDVIAYLVLLRPAFESIKGVAYRYVRR